MTTKTVTRYTVRTISGVLGRMYTVHDCLEGCDVGAVEYFKDEAEARARRLNRADDLPIEESR